MQRIRLTVWAGLVHAAVGRWRALMNVALAQPTCANQPPVRLTVAFVNSARLGAPSPIADDLRIAAARRAAPLTELTLQYPAALGITTSDLGLAGCRRPATDFRLVAIDGAGLAGCPPNAAMALGDARAAVQLGTYRFTTTALLTILAGDYDDGQLGLLAYVDGVNPLAASSSIAAPPVPRRRGSAVSCR